MKDMDLTFEKVLAAFQDYLVKDDYVEVIKTSRGYAVIEWDDRLDCWAQIEHCPLPTILQQSLLDNMAVFLEYNYTAGERELTDEEKAQISLQQKSLSEIN